MKTVKRKINADVYVINTTDINYKKEAWYFNGKLHRDDGPAVTEITNEGTKELWYDHFKLYKEHFVGKEVEITKHFKNGKLNNPSATEPAVIEYTKGMKHANLKFFNNGIITREVNYIDNFIIEIIYNFTIDGVRYDKIKYTYKNKKLIEEEFYEKDKIQTNKIIYKTLNRKEIRKFINGNFYSNSYYLKDRLIEEEFIYDEELSSDDAASTSAEVDVAVSKVSKETGVDEIKVKNILHKNLDKLDNETVYRFVASECTGINNFEGTCYANGVVQFLSPLAEDLEFDNIKSFINKYCPVKKNNYVGATGKEVEMMLKNVVDDIQSYDKNFISLLNTNYTANVVVANVDDISGVASNFILLKSNAGINIKTIKNMPMLLKYRPKSFLLYTPDHVFSIRVCKNKLKLFDDTKVIDLKCSLKELLTDPDILNSYSHVYISSILFQKM